MLRVYIKTPGGAWTEYTPVLRPDRMFEIGGRAYMGEADQGEITVDDPDYTLDVYEELAGHREVKVTEDDSGSELILSLGRIGPKSMERGAGKLGREVTLTVEDVNCDLRGIRVDKWNRPEESGLDRVKALRLALLNGAASTRPAARDSTDIDIDLFVPDEDEITMPAKFYDATDPLSVLRECAEWEGKNVFVYPADNGDKELFYARPNDLTLHNCTLEVSDDPADIDYATVFPIEWSAGPALQMDPLETATGVVFIHPDGSRTYDNDAAREAIHDKWEEAMYVDEPPGAAADAHLAAVLLQRSIEEVRRQGAIRLPGSKVHLIKQGMLLHVIQANAAAIPNVTAGSQKYRVAQVRYKWAGPHDTDDNTYLVIVMLEFARKLSRHWGAGKPGATSTPPTPKPAPEVTPQPPDTITGIVEWTWTDDQLDETDTYDSEIVRDAENTEYFATPHGRLGNSGEKTNPVPVTAGTTVVAAMQFRWKWNPADRPIRVQFWTDSDASDHVETWTFESGAGRAVDTVYDLSGSHLVPVGANYATFTWPSGHGLSRVDNMTLGTIDPADEVEQDPHAVDYGNCPHASRHTLPSDWIICQLADLRDQITSATAPDAIHAVGRWEPVTDGVDTFVWNGDEIVVHFVETETE